MKTPEYNSGFSVLGALLLGGAVVVSVVLHVLVALTLAAIPKPEPKPPMWVVIEATPPPPTRQPLVEQQPTPPPPKPTPPPPRPKPPPTPPKVVDYDKTVDEPAITPPDKPRPIRLKQGLQTTSTVPGANTGIAVPLGNTTMTPASGGPGVEGPFTTVPYVSVSTQPKVRTKPPLAIPQAVIDGGIEGRVGVEVTVGPDGSVVEAVVIAPLTPEADASCLANARASKWRPGTTDGVPVGVRGVPYSCRFEEVID